MKKTTNKIAVRVTDNDDNFDGGADSAVIVITPVLKGLILKAQEKLLALKKELDGVYDIRIFDISPKFLGVGEFEELAGSKVLQQLESFENVSLSEKQFKTLNESENTVRTDVELLQVKEQGFYWTGIYKHTSVRFMTSVISFEALAQMTVK